MYYSSFYVWLLRHPLPIPPSSRHHAQIDQIRANILE
jgi:hypothetical protein